MDFLIDEIGKPATKIIAIVGVVAVFTLLRLQMAQEP